MKIHRTIDRDSKQKLYVQIYSIIKEKIENGEWTSGTQIPTEDEFCRTYDVSKVTVREAIQELVREGYLKRQQGKGTFVLYSVSHLGLLMRTRLTDVMYGEGVTIRKELLDKRSIKPSEDIKSVLRTEDEVFYARYTSSVESGCPVMEEVYIPLITLLSINDEDILYRPFFDVIEEKGSKKISKVTQTIEVVKLKEDIAHQLQMKEGTHALCVNRIFFSADGSPIAFSRGIIGGMKKVSMEFERLK